MSNDDEVFGIATTFGDVAELGQGYINRADGERMLLPLPQHARPGEGVRFIVHLADGTPAFAGAGRCIQVSDQGEAAAPGDRYETLLDSLAFDERSRPVYDYIVAVRQAVYAAGGPETAEAAAEEAEMVAEVEAAELSPNSIAPGAEEEAILAEAPESESEAAAVEEASFEAAAEDEFAPESDYVDPAEQAAAAEEEEPEEATAFVERVDMMASVSVSMSEPPAAAPAHEAELDSEAEAEPAEAAEYEPQAEPAAETYAAEPQAEAEYEPEPQPAYVPEPEPEPELHAPAYSADPLPTGMLQRPAIAAHWQPAAPRMPQPSARSGMFRYSSAGLPVPAQPPRPAIDPGLRVSRAPSPAA